MSRRFFGLFLITDKIGYLITYLIKHFLKLRIFEIDRFLNHFNRMIRVPPIQVRVEFRMMKNFRIRNSQATLMTIWALRSSNLGFQLFQEKR